MAGLIGHVVAWTPMMIVEDLFRPMGVLIGLLIVFSPATAAESSSPVRLYVRAVPITIFGKAGKVIAIEQSKIYKGQVTSCLV
jgi:hypothetical protein